MSGQLASSLNSIFLGEVSAVQSYGAFVKIPGCTLQGLVHRSQMSKFNVPDVSEVLSKGDRVWCKVITTADDGKIGLSMKVVDQGNGKDLDPNGVQIKLDEQRRREWTPGDKRKVISLDAVFNTTCSKCGTRGHLSKDCFQVVGGKTYQLIPEEDIESASASSKVEGSDVCQEEQMKRAKKEAKKLEKEAKRQKKAAKKLKKKLKKEAKQTRKIRKANKKNKTTSSDESSGSSDSSSSSSDRGDKNHPQSMERTLKRRKSRSRSSSREGKRSRRHTEVRQEKVPRFRSNERRSHR